MLTPLEEVILKTLKLTIAQLKEISIMMANYSHRKSEAFLKKTKFPSIKVYSSEWCRCKETALIAFKRFETKNFLNSFYSEQFAKNKKKQIIDFRKFLNNWDENENLVFVTHYVVISELLNYAPSSGEIVISDKDLKVIDSLEIEY
jgi:phosphohistidine phosphatase SixA